MDSPSNLLTLIPLDWSGPFPGGPNLWPEALGDPVPMAYDLRDLSRPIALVHPSCHGSQHNDVVGEVIK